MTVLLCLACFQWDEETLVNDGDPGWRNFSQFMSREAHLLILVFGIGQNFQDRSSVHLNDR